MPVRDNSRWAGDPVLASFSRRTTDYEVRLARRALRAFSVTSRTLERVRQERPLRCGEVWRSAEVVYLYLAEFARDTAEVYPEVETIAEACGLGESTVHVAKEQLKALGLIDWRHRAEPSAEVGPGQPPIRQISNLYRVNELPPRILCCLEGPQRMAYGLELARGRKVNLRRVKQAREASAKNAARMKDATRARAAEIAKDLQLRRERNATDPAGGRSGFPSDPRDSS